VNAYGVEGEASHSFGSALELRAAFTYTHARVDGASIAPQLTGLKPAQTPSTTLTVATWRALDRLTLIGDVRYESARFDDDQNTRKIKSGAGLNGRAEWSATPGLIVFVATDNLLDANIETGRSAANIVTYDAPRIIRVGLTLRR
jgi:outer membrane receptor protein involved in Fe transport